MTTTADRSSRQRTSALTWAAAIVVIEAAARRTMESRARAWMAAYAVLGAASVIVPRRSGVTDTAAPGAMNSQLQRLIGSALVTSGYGAGRRFMGDRPSAPPDDSLIDDIVALTLVATVEELTWGRRVQPALGVPLTAALFAVKHPLIDGNWRRVPGLMLFGLGIGILRRDSATRGALAHAAANASGVVIGHRRGIDQF